MDAYDRLDEILGDLTKLGPAEAKRIREQVWQAHQENQTRLSGCPEPHHRFGPPEGKVPRVIRTCGACGGRVQEDQFRWYELGRVHQQRAHDQNTTAWARWLTGRGPGGASR